jgi:hypothetical protein
MSKAHKEYDAQFEQIKQVGVVVAFKEPLVSASAIDRQISEILRLPIGDVTHRTIEILNWLQTKIRQDLDKMLSDMEAEDQYREILVADAYGSPSYVKLIPNYQSIENTPEWRRDNQSEQGF